MVSKVKPELTKTERLRLENEGLIEIVSRGRAKHIVLTDKAWDLALDQFVVKGVKSNQAAPILDHILTRLKAYLNSQQIPLAEFLSANHLSANKINPIKPEVDIETRIRDAYSQITRQSEGGRVRLSELRKKLDDLSRPDLDQVLGQMELSGKLVLMHLDDPQEIYPEDEQAALDIGGHKSHILYMKA